MNLNEKRKENCEHHYSILKREKFLESMIIFNGNTNITIIINTGLKTKYVSANIWVGLKNVFSNAF